MLIYLLVRQTQSDLGYIDTDIIGAFTKVDDAKTSRALTEAGDLEDEMRVEGREAEWQGDVADIDGDDWDVSYYITPTTLEGL